MAMNFKGTAFVSKTPTSKGPQDYATARASSLANFEKQIKAVKDHLALHKRLPQGQDLPAGLVKVDAEGRPCIGWRISNNNVHFDPESKASFYYQGDDWEAALRNLKAEIEAGNFETELQEAFTRKGKGPSDFQIERRAARAAAKQAGELTYTCRGKKYTVNPDRVVKP